MRKKHIFALIILVLLALAIWQLPVKTYLEQALLWVEANQGLAWIVFGVLYILAIVLLLPASLFSLAAGYLFGLLQGWLLVVVTATIGASLSLLVGRSLLRGWVLGRARDMPNFANLDDAVSKKGFLIVFLTRLSPVFPFSLINYVYGVTKITPRDYTIATFFGIMPGSLLYVYFGTTAKNLQEVLSGNVETSSGQQWFLYAGLVATLILTIVITRIAKHALIQAAHIEPAPGVEHEPELEPENKNQTEQQTQ
ncbi:MAG: TVP38/TMEM64 family protein [Gammaproteobacteria bacterium]|nr:TVP38/TMEM64 family protein [Gammaproteobacteria bacterium]NNC97682.1 TVP38/TMEM64 family protein [Gammaproteobacteria bacterium]NNM12858.1 TVP38/TMEM64 family protein [Gammaproteobacteria bacterium]